MSSSSSGVKSPAGGVASAPSTRHRPQIVFVPENVLSSWQEAQSEDNYQIEHISTQCESDHQAFYQKLSSYRSHVYFIASTFLSDAIHFRSSLHLTSRRALRIYNIMQNERVKAFFQFCCLIQLALGFVEPPKSSFGDFTLTHSACYIIELFILLCYLIHIIMAIIAHGAESYSASGWRLMRSVIILYSIISILVTWISYPHEDDDPHRIVIWEHIRKMLRVFFAFQASATLRKLLSTFIKTLSSIFSVLLLCAIQILAFGIFAYIVIRPVESDWPKAGMPMEVIGKDNVTIALPQSTDRYFNTIGRCFLSLTILLTSENFPDVMLPSYRNQYWVFLFFVVFLFVGFYTIYQMLLAIAMNAYKDRSDEEIKNDKMKRQNAIRQSYLLLTKYSQNGMEHYQALQATYQQQQQHYTSQATGVAGGPSTLQQALTTPTKVPRLRTRTSSGHSHSHSSPHHTQTTQPHTQRVHHASTGLVLSAASHSYSRSNNHPAAATATGQHAASSSSSSSSSSAAAAAAVTASSSSSASARKLKRTTSFNTISVATKKFNLLSTLQSLSNSVGSALKVFPLFSSNKSKETNTAAAAATAAAAPPASAASGSGSGSSSLISAVDLSQYVYMYDTGIPFSVYALLLQRRHPLWRSSVEVRILYLAVKSWSKAKLFHQERVLFRIMRKYVRRKKQMKLDSLHLDSLATSLNDAHMAEKQHLPAANATATTTTTTTTGPDPTQDTVETCLTSLNLQNIEKENLTYEEFVALFPYLRTLFHSLSYLPPAPLKSVTTSPAAAPAAASVVPPSSSAATGAAGATAGAPSPGDAHESIGAVYTFHPYDLITQGKQALLHPLVKAEEARLRESRKKQLKEEAEAAEAAAAIGAVASTSATAVEAEEADLPTSTLAMAAASGNVTSSALASTLRSFFLFEARVPSLLVHVTALFSIQDQEEAERESEKQMYEIIKKEKQKAHNLKKLRLAAAAAAIAAASTALNVQVELEHTTENTEDGDLAAVIKVKPANTTATTTNNNTSSSSSSSSAAASAPAVSTASPLDVQHASTTNQLRQRHTRGGASSTSSSAATATPEDAHYFTRTAHSILTAQERQQRLAKQRRRQRLQAAGQKAAATYGDDLDLEDETEEEKQLTRQAKLEARQEWKKQQQQQSQQQSQQQPSQQTGEGLNDIDEHDVAEEDGLLDAEAELDGGGLDSLDEDELDEAEDDDDDDSRPVLFHYESSVSRSTHSLPRRHNHTATPQIVVTPAAATQPTRQTSSSSTSTTTSSGAGVPLKLALPLNVDGDMTPPPAAAGGGGASSPHRLLAQSMQAKKRKHSIFTFETDAPLIARGFALPSSSAHAANASPPALSSPGPSSQAFVNSSNYPYRQISAYTATAPAPTVQVSEMDRLLAMRLPKEKEKEKEKEGEDADADADGADAEKKADGESDDNVPVITEYAVDNPLEATEEKTFYLFDFAIDLLSVCHALYYIFTLAALSTYDYYNDYTRFPHVRIVAYIALAIYALEWMGKLYAFGLSTLFYSALDKSDKQKQKKGLFNLLLSNISASVSDVWKKATNSPSAAASPTAASAATTTPDTTTAAAPTAGSSGAANRSGLASVFMDKSHIQNSIDFFLVLLAIGSHIFAETQTVELVSPAVIMIHLRVIRLSFHVDKFHIIFSSIFNVGPEAPFVFLMLVLLQYAFAQIGMCVFHDLLTPTKVDPSMGYFTSNYFVLNFDSLAASYITLLYVLLINNWQLIMEATATASNNDWARLFFISYFVAVCSLTMNIFVASMMNSYDAQCDTLEKQEEKRKKKEEQLKRLKKRELEVQQEQEQQAALTRRLQIIAQEQIQTQLQAVQFHNAAEQNKQQPTLSSSQKNATSSSSLSSLSRSTMTSTTTTSAAVTLPPPPPPSPPEIPAPDASSANNEFKQSIELQSVSTKTITDPSSFSAGVQSTEDEVLSGEKALEHLLKGLSYLDLHYHVVLHAYATGYEVQVQKSSSYKHKIHEDVNIPG